MSEPRTFHIGVILSYTTGRLVAPGGIGDVHEFAEYMVGEPVWTHQLPRVFDEVAPVLRERYRDLGAVEEPDLEGKDAVDAWLAEQVERFGETREVSPLAATDHTSIDPISEIKMIRPDMPIIGVVVDGDGGAS